VRPALREAVAQGLVPGDGEQPEHVLELGVRDGATDLVDLGEQDRRDVAAR
jgi:hypothetical protein